jgi:hypothetical protein
MGILPFLIGDKMHKVKLTTTPRMILDHRPCTAGFVELLTFLDIDFCFSDYTKATTLPDRLFLDDVIFGDESDLDREINLLTILESNGDKDLFWAFQVVKQDIETLKNFLFYLYWDFCILFPSYKRGITRNKLIDLLSTDYKDTRVGRIGYTREEFETDFKFTAYNIFAEYLIIPYPQDKISRMVKRF